MAHEKQCPVCGKMYWGNINKLYCTDGCRKYASRHPEKVAPVANQLPKQEPMGPQLSVKGRTSSGSLLNYAGKKAIDYIAERLTKGVVDGEKNNDDQTEPLKPESLTVLKVMKMTRGGNSLIPMSNEFIPFLGKLSTPFKMLVWGMPGQGKSTFCLKLANMLSATSKLLYISAEENPDGDTFNDKVDRAVKNNLHNIIVARRLPNNKEWQDLFLINQQPNACEYRNVMYDSISVLDITPNYPNTLAKKLTYSAFSAQVNHIFISHAQKDGKSYLGPSIWGHDVDIIIRIQSGQAIIEKNRFATDVSGQIGATYQIF
jgi:predicted ATP-dependent serine protease